jgi:hypothetical protein
MNARYYVGYINRFLSPDPIIPDPTNPQSFNRYSYVLNRPTKYVDPTGHNWECPDPSDCDPGDPSSPSSGGSSEPPIGGYQSLPDDPPPGVPDPEDCVIFRKCPADTAENLLPLPLEGNPGWTALYDKDDHPGFDMISDDYTIIAIGNGVVVVVSNDELYGNYVIIEYRYENLPQDVREALNLQPGQSIYVQYQHMEAGSITVSPGDYVSAGQVVGTMGNTGRSDGIHLHVEIRIGKSDTFEIGTFSFDSWDDLIRKNPRLIWAIPKWE